MTAAPSPTTATPQHAPATVVFLDRDGTIIRDVHYLSRPEQVELLEGAAEAIARLNAARIPVILITNQSGIARGYFTDVDYRAAHARLVELLGAEGARLDAAYYCPHHPDVVACNCRKPGEALFRQAIADHHLDPSRPASIGDRWRDLAPVLALGGRGILTPTPHTPPDEVDRAARDAEVAPTLADAVDLLLGPRLAAALPSAPGNH